MTIWNERYGKEDFLFGREPNQFFRESIKGLSPGTMLLPAEGEGRNAVFAAKLGWEVDAFDASSVGRDKALLFAEEENVSINFRVGMIEDFQPEPGKYNVIALVYCHLHPAVRKPFFEKLVESLTPGGLLIMEAFRKEQLGNKSGGPSDPELLYSADVLAEEFGMLSKLAITPETVWLEEGYGHQGEARVIRLTGVR